MRVFDLASTYVMREGLVAEIEWQRRVELHEFSETDLLREAAWVVLCSGFRERIVRRVFGHVTLCFCDWESASAIVDADPNCCLAAMASFRNAAKLSAIAKIARYVEIRGFATFKAAVLGDPLTELQRLPYIGPITVWHLAKNLGLDVAKPDRHLAKVSALLGFASADHFCSELARKTGETRKVVDLIVWRYLADNAQSGVGDYGAIFAGGSCEDRMLV